jgi:hypothetical protein
MPSAPKGRNKLAQGNALGCLKEKRQALKGRDNPRLNYRAVSVTR